jgi:putative mRNA 3-end processing factor
MPNRYQVMASMERFVKQNSDSVLVFGAYTTGKAQEIVAFLNRECRVAPVVGKRAAGVCAAYGKCGVRLDYIEAGSEEAEEQMRHPFAAIMPPREVNHSFAARLSAGLGKKVKTAVATGWAAVTKFPVDAAFALSDHADFADTMRYIGESGAKRVICANSNSSEAAAYLRSVGIDAASKEELGEGKGRQKTLATC